MTTPEKRIAKLLGGYETTVYPTMLGDLWRSSNVNGPVIKLLGPQSEPCVHYLSAAEARDVAAALLEIADEIDPVPREIPIRRRDPEETRALLLGGPLPPDLAQALADEITP